MEYFMPFHLDVEYSVKCDDQIKQKEGERLKPFTGCRRKTSAYPMKMKGSG